MLSLLLSSCQVMLSHIVFLASSFTSLHQTQCQSYVSRSHPQALFCRGKGHWPGALIVCCGTLAWHVLPWSRPHDCTDMVDGGTVVQVPTYDIVLIMPHPCLVVPGCPAPKDPRHVEGSWALCTLVSVSLAEHPCTHAYKCIPSYHTRVTPDSITSALPGLCMCFP